MWATDNLVKSDKMPTQDEIDARNILLEAIKSRLRV